MTGDANAEFARALVDGWVRSGVKHAVIAPGSRSAPLAYAVAGDERVSLHVVLDERAAAFVALGIGRASGMPAIVVTTSGTAAANLHPAVLEAHHGGVPLIACTADRPPELRETGAPQTINQARLFGDAVRWFVDARVPGRAIDGDADGRALAARSVAEARLPYAGPVHLNLPFAEPLVPASRAPAAAPIDEGATAGDVAGSLAAARVPPDPSSAEVATLVHRVQRHPHGLLIAGWGNGVSAGTAARFARAAGWPIVADSLSDWGAAPGAVSRAEALVRAEEFAATHAPTFAVRVGAASTSATLTRWLEGNGTEVLLLDGEARWREPAYGATATIVADADRLLSIAADHLERSGVADPAWRDGWQHADVIADRAITATLVGWSACSEPRIARDTEEAVPSGGVLVVASSMPVRDVDWFGRARSDRRIIANRGVNGIDGFVSTAVGVALAEVGPVVALTGDLTFLHDGGGRLAATDLAPDLVIVVVDNNGGGIFSFLPQAEFGVDFERLFGTPPNVDIGALARAHGFAVERVESPDELGPAIASARDRGGPVVVLVATDRDRNVEHHREVWDAVAVALREA